MDIAPELKKGGDIDIEQRVSPQEEQGHIFLTRLSEEDRLGERRDEVVGMRREGKARAHKPEESRFLFEI